MGNDNSLVRHIDHAKKTGVCVLKEQKLSEVSSRAINSPVNQRSFSYVYDLCFRRTELLIYNRDLL